MINTTQFIVDWSNRMMQHGWCGCVTCETLAEFMGESGNEKPSLDACNKAIKWENDESEMIEYIKSQNKWCSAPTLGCRRYCTVWKKNVWKKDIT